MVCYAIICYAMRFQQKRLNTQKSLSYKKNIYFMHEKKMLTKRRIDHRSVWIASWTMSQDISADMNLKMSNNSRICEK